MPLFSHIRLSHCVLPWAALGWRLYRHVLPSFAAYGILLFTSASTGQDISSQSGRILAQDHMCMQSRAAVRSAVSGRKYLRGWISREFKSRITLIDTCEQRPHWYLGPLRSNRWHHPVDVDLRHPGIMCIELVWESKCHALN
jgi:hypothetical protein